jgi:hypothetical protein
MTSNNRVRFVSSYAGRLFGIAFVVAIAMSIGAGFNGRHAAAATTYDVIANSKTANNRAIHFRLSDYWYMRSQTNWPIRTSCASGIDRPWDYKFMPWLANNRLPSTSGVIGSGSPSYYDGNTINTNGDCRSRYTDGGGYGNGDGTAWLDPYALSGWAMPGGGSGLGNTYVSYSTVSCNGLTGGSAPMIWGASGPDYGDQAYGPSGLLSLRDGRTTYMSNGFGLYSNGTSIIRNDFNISGPQYSEIQSTGSVSFYAIADDWIRVFINGTQVVSTTYTKQPVASIPSSYFVQGQNVIAIQVIDKANWTTRDNPSSRQSGVCYNLAVANNTPPPPPFICANATDFNIDKLVLTGSFTVSGRNNASTVPPNDNFQVTVWWQGSSGGSPSAVKTLSVPNMSGGAPPTDVTSAPIDYTDINATRVGYYYITWTYAGSGPGGGGAPCQSATSLLSFHPYFSVLGGDISAGPGFGTSCSANTSAIIKGWNLGSTYSYAGAGANLAAFALGRITGFATAQGGITGAPGSPGAPSQLAFANTTATGGTPTSTYGGLWGASNSCVPDYAALASAQKITAGTPDYSTPGNRTYTLSGNQTLGAITVGQGAHITLVVTGNVYISQPITYSAYGGSVDNIPEFSLLVKGNIYIDGNVSELHGFYDAQPASSGAPTGGGLYTCATGLGAATSDYDTCSGQLIFYGAVAAGKIYLERSYGTLTSSVAPVDGARDAAEKIIFTPEFWLTASQSPTNGTGLDDWLATASLPPVL